MKCRATAASRFSTFFEKAFVSRVNRRMLIRMVKFCRSTNEVETYLGSGWPSMRVFRQPVHCAGL
jgi:hypothetical protein